MRLCQRYALLALLLLAALPRGARADEPVFVRLYYSTWMTGRVEQSPLDPAGAFTGSDGLVQNPRSELEAIFLRRLGLSYARQKLERRLVDGAGRVGGCSAPPCDVVEHALQQSLNLTLYGRAVRHDQFNLFAGAGAGYLDYDYAVNGTPQTGGSLHRGLSLSRWFLGLEYTFERVGFRLELSRVSAYQALEGQEARAAATYRYLTLVIPLN